MALGADDQRSAVAPIGKSRRGEQVDAVIVGRTVVGSQTCVAEVLKFGRFGMRVIGNAGIIDPCGFRAGVV